ncbi:CHRD domain-containing protein [Methylobacterium planeticum]|uniref:CHRD domain-containing protein n=1 Tax=Methylobacterium planeticum TaxID=2615211 RepID=A0A6N6MHW1_9HYPH|nr:CHRD domain-containing protein [Methylobacterium planeticum]KAB1069943.1 CHRD domain-containing protein [Methylobacterium planeticum]
MTHAFRSGLTALALAASLGTAQAAGETVTYKATLNGSSEVPATTTKGFGEVTATFDAASKKLTWKGSYSGLTGPVTAAHFHGPAKAGENAGVLIPVTVTESPFSGSATLDDAKAADLTAGKLYFNVHTSENPKGEIRGQVEKAP